MELNSLKQFYRVFIAEINSFVVYMQEKWVVKIADFPVYPVFPCF